MSRRQKSSPDLYGTLGVDPGATAAEIKAAYRSAAKSAHPDTGGSAKEFESVNRAYLVLSDKAKRARYDATGEIDEPATDPTESMAMSFIHQMLSAILVDDTDPTECDLIAAMLGVFGKNIAEQKELLKMLNRSKERATRLQKLFKRKAAGAGDEKGEANLFQTLLDHQVKEFKAKIALAEMTIAGFKRAIELVQQYDFESSPPAMVTFSMMWPDTSASGG